jgi:hypothetical protein
MSVLTEPPRVVPWVPVAGWCALAVAPAVFTIARDGRNLAVATLAGALVLGAALPTGLDDAAQITVAAVPVSRSRRRAARLWWTTLALLLTGALLAVAVTADDGIVGVGLLHVVALGAASAAMALAFAARLPNDVAAVRAGVASSAGALLTVLVIAALSVRVRWLPSPGVADDTLRWWLVAGAASVTAWPIGRDPACPARRRRRGVARRLSGD